MARDSAKKYPANSPERGRKPQPAEPPSPWIPGTDASEHAIEQQRARSLDAPLPGEESDGGESILSGHPREADADET